MMILQALIHIGMFVLGVYITFKGFFSMLPLDFGVGWNSTVGMLVVLIGIGLIGISISPLLDDYKNWVPVD